jgi:hypothetical protein
MTLLLFSVAVIAQNAKDSTIQAIERPVPRKILFVGDSFTYYQNGVYAQLEKLAAMANPPVTVTADKSVFGGAFLHRL